MNSTELNEFDKQLLTNSFKYQEMPNYPQEGSIQYFEDYDTIVVKLN